MRALMLRFSHTFILLLVLGCVSSPPHSPTESSLDTLLVSRGYIPIPLQKVSSGHLILKSEINGVPGMLILDSGASVTFIDSAASKALSLRDIEETSIPAIGLGPTGTAKTAVLGSLVIGPLTFRNRHVFLLDLTELTKVVGLMSGQQIYGVLGQDIFESHSAIIDIRNRLLYLKPE